MESLSGKIPCKLWPKAKTKAGYGVIRLKDVLLYVHQLSLILKLGRSLAIDELSLHHCDNPSCYEPEHLYAGTPSNNIQDAWDRGRMSRPNWKGEACSFAKLTWPEVREIRRRLKLGQSGSSLAKRYNVSPTNISQIKHNKIWVE